MLFPGWTRDTGEAVNVLVVPSDLLFPFLHIQNEMITRFIAFRSKKSSETQQVL